MSPSVETYHLKSFYPHGNLSTRSLVSRLSSKAFVSPCVELDFEGIKLVSRAFAHELLLLQQKIEAANNVSFEFINLSDDVLRTFKIVSDSLQKSCSEFDGISEKLNRLTQNLSHSDFKIPELSIEVPEISLEDYLSKELP